MAQGWTGIAPREGGRYLFACSEENCYRHLMFATLEQAQAEQADHDCPWQGNSTHYAWSATVTLVRQLWEKLDAEVEQIKQGETNGEWHKARATAFAEAIVLFMQPFFPTTQSVSEEALRRYEAKANGDDEYETAGIGSRRYEAAVRQDKPRAAAAKTPPSMDPSRVGEKERIAIKQALSMEMFSVAELSKMYKLSTDMIEAIRNS